MGWLRRDGDCIGLVLAWAILVQAAIVSFTSGLHAAALASAGGEAAVLCTLKGPVKGETPPGQARHGRDSQCCLAACRLAWSGNGEGLLANAAILPIPPSAALLLKGPRFDAPTSKSVGHDAARPRAPPAV
jgi:hypothetical protein